MYDRHGSKKNVAWRMIATFGSEQQRLSYVRWATLSGLGDKSVKFEQGEAHADEALVEGGRHEVPR